MKIGLGYYIGNFLNGFGSIQYQPESEAFFARNATISKFEKEIVDAMVVRAKAAGNLALLDEMFLPLNDGDPRVGFFSKTGSLSGGSSINSNGFFNFDGINGYLDTGFNLDADGVNYQLNDALISFFMKEYNESGIINFLGSRTSLLNNHNNGASGYRVNTTLDKFRIAELFEAGQLITLSRDANNSTKCIIDGGENNTSSTLSVEVEDNNMILGASNSGGIPSGYYEATIGMIVIGAGVGFDHVAHNEYTRLYIASLISGTNVSNLAAANIIIDAA